jgi:ABC-2 type transport system permease protein
MPIFDQGYQHWDGALAAQPWRWLAVTRHGVRVGLSGRVMKLLVFVAWLPALILALLLCLWGLVEQQSLLVAPLAPAFQGLGGSSLLAEPRAFRTEIWTLFYSYFLSFQLSYAMILLLVVGPSLISQDLRFNALPLYLSRPLRRIDYFLGKLGVVAAFLCLVIVVPSFLAYFLGVLFSLDATVIRDTFRIPLACAAYGLVISVSAGTLMLALSSISRSSRYVALFWLCVWLVSTMVSTVFELVQYHETRHFSRQEMLNERREGFQFNMRQRAELDERTSAKLQASAPRDWRPLLSYRANLARIGDALVGRNAAIARLAELQPENFRQTFSRATMGYQYPWQWSALVLAAYFGLSACILNLSIRSLDRLK